MAFALTKGEHPEWAVQKLTEAGADRVVIMVTDRCVARWAPNNEGRQLDRLREIARQAAMQSRRCWLPLVEGPVPFSALVGGDDGRPGNGEVALAEQGGGPLTLATPTVLVGPEGGWSDEELAAVPEGRRVALGPNVMRAETSAMAAGVLLGALRAGLVRPAGSPVALTLAGGGAVAAVSVGGGARAPLLGLPLPVFGCGPRNRLRFSAGSVFWRAQLRTARPKRS